MRVLQLNSIKIPHLRHLDFLSIAHNKRKHFFNKENSLNLIRFQSTRFQLNIKLFSKHAESCTQLDETNKVYRMPLMKAFGTQLIWNIMLFYAGTVRILVAEAVNRRQHRIVKAYFMCIYHNSIFHSHAHHHQCRHKNYNESTVFRWLGASKLPQFFDVNASYTDMPLMYTNTSAFMLNIEAC